jgi:F-type H+-transporting ATPase subunit delta
MKISKQERRQAKGLFSTCQLDGVLDENRVRQAVEALISRKPRGYLAILEHFKRLIRLDVARRTALVESAVPLAETMQQTVRENLIRRYGQGLQVRFRENAALLGGLRVQIGSDVFDGSVRARLTGLKESFETAA